MDMTTVRLRVLFEEGVEFAPEDLHAAVKVGADAVETLLAAKEYDLTEDGVKGWAVIGADGSVLARTGKADLTALEV